MDEAEWLASNDADRMFAFLREKRGESRRRSGRRKLRLFAATCLRRIWPLLRNVGSRKALEIAERFADGHASDAELEDASNAACLAFAEECGCRLTDFTDGVRSCHWQSAEAVRHVTVRRFTAGDHHSVAHTSGSSALAQAFGKLEQAGESDYSRRLLEEQSLQQGHHADCLRDIFGNPFRPVVFDAAWQTPAVLALAAAAYDHRTLPAGTLEPDRLAILADALEEAGCTDADILGHLRGPGPHTRGCWPLDLLLGRA